MILAGDSAVLGDVELPGPGKRAMSPPPAPPAYKKHLKTSKNPLLSGNIDIDSQPEAEKEFDFPPAEKIGIGLSEEWSDLKETPPPAPSPVPWLQDFMLPREEEEVWWETDLQSKVSLPPTHLEETQPTQPVMAVTTSSSTTNQKIPRLTETDNSELDAFWRPGLESLLNENEKFDIVEFAMGEDQDLTDDEPSKTKMDIDEDYLPDLKLKAEPTEFVDMKPVENVSIEIIAETPRKSKRKAGRPINQDPITVTVIPKACKLSDAELKALKYRRTRELNNQASRRFRLKKKAKEEMELQELAELEAHNNQLQLTVGSMEKEVALWRVRVADIK